MDTRGFERRAAAELRFSKNRVEGYAAVFDSPSQDLGGFIEIVKPGAFARSLKSPDSILAMFDHDTKSILGRVGAGTLRLSEDTRGLHFEIDLPDTSVGKDLRILIDRGDVAGASFAFKVPKGGDKWAEENRQIKRALLDVDLKEVTITSSPAYLETSVALRSLHQFKGVPRLSVARRFLETCR